MNLAGNQFYRRILCAFFGLLLMPGCQSIPTHQPIAPNVSVDSITPLKLGIRNQQLAIGLLVANPNSFDLPLQTLSFIANLDGAEVARGSSSRKVTLPAHGETNMEILVTTRISKVLGKILLMSSQNSDNIAYDVKGFVKLANWPLRIPFNVDGTVDTPSLTN